MEKVPLLRCRVSTDEDLLMAQMLWRSQNLSKFLRGVSRDRKMGRHEKHCVTLSCCSCFLGGFHVAKNGVVIAEMVGEDLVSTGT